MKITTDRKPPSDFSAPAKSIIIGNLYEHYKGLSYKVIAIARHSETLEEVVVYQACYGAKDVWVRPVTIFTETITINGKTQPRFKSIS